MRAYYYACISFVDYNIGRLLDYLSETGELENTLIIFTSDHGELLGDYNSFGKRCFLDSAARIPISSAIRGGAWAKFYACISAGCNAHVS